MTAPTFSTIQSISELCDQHAIYLKALQLLIQDKATLKKAQKTVCWNRLNRLHEAMPNRYLDPQTLFANMQAKSQANSGYGK